MRLNFHFILVFRFRKVPKAAIGYTYGDSETVVVGHSKKSESEESDDDDFEDQQEYGLLDINQVYFSPYSLTI